MVALLAELDPDKVNEFAAASLESLPEQLACTQWNSTPSAAPEYPETCEEAHVRYTAALEAIADRHAGKHVLVVTHGEAVRRSVARLVSSHHTKRAYGLFEAQQVMGLLQHGVLCQLAIARRNHHSALLTVKRGYVEFAAPG